jgi:hypothetical protein
MVRDEAPAATTGGFNEREFDRAEVSSAAIADLHFTERPDQLRCCGNPHPGPRPAGIYGGWPHCNIQVACHPNSKNKIIIYQTIAGLSWSPTLALPIANSSNQPNY